MIFYAKAKTDELISKLKFSNELELTKFLVAEAENGYKGNYVVNIERETRKRTLKQNDYYWMYLGHIEKETGNLATELHELFKRKFLPPIPKSIWGVDFKIPSSTTNLSKTEFSDYMDKISAFTEIPIPEPIKKEFDIQTAHANLEVPEGEVKF